MGNTRRIAAGIALGALATPVLAASVLAASPRYEAVAGNFTLPTVAHTYVAWLGAHGFKGYAVEREKMTGAGQYQVERSFTTKGAAAAEIRRLRATYHRGGVEVDFGSAR
ncbi:MAG: hypothetical protein ACYDAK_06390 [Candidatus Limnocylindrales bacterium]